ncbi:MAG: hypothetical protein Q8O46_01125 [bacterium]|nr:hypothetical protein [bacterium]
MQQTIFLKKLFFLGTFSTFFFLTPAFFWSTNIEAATNGLYNTSSSVSCVGTPPANPQVFVDWNDVPSATEHEIRRGLGGPFMMFTGAISSFTDLTPTYGIINTYQINAIDALLQPIDGWTHDSDVATCNATINVTTQGAPTSGTWNITPENKTGTLNTVRPISSPGTSYTITVTPPGTYTAIVTNSKGGGSTMNMFPGDNAIFNITYSPAVVNQSPTANAGFDKAITLPTSTSAPTGTSETDTDGTIFSRSWSVSSSPGGSSPSIFGDSTLNPTFNNLTVAGTYVFCLRVTDDDLATNAPCDDIVNDTDMMTVTVFPAVAAPDLTAVAPTPATATAGSGQTYTSTISNLSSSVGTVTGFNNFFQTATLPNGGGTVIDQTSSAMAALGASGSATSTSPSISFAAGTTPSIRACANKTSSATTLPPGSGTFTESNWGNNCSLWTNVTVSAANAVPTIDTPNSSSVLSTSAVLGATVRTLGVPTPLTARGVCYSSTTVNPSLTNGATCVTATLLQTVPSAFTVNVSSLTASTTYNYRGYATNTTGTGYTANTTFATAAPGGMSGTLLPASSVCTIASGGSSCLSGTLTWTTTNPIGTSNVTNNGSATPAAPTGNNSSSTFTVPYNVAMGGVTSFFLNNNAQQLAVATVTTFCITGSTWNVSLCVANSAPTVITPTVFGITSTGATLGANVTSLGIPAAISARGTCWATTAAPTTNCVAEGATTTGIFTHARTGMPSSTTIFYRGYATNTSGTGYSADGTFTTLAAAVAPTVDTSAVTNITQSSADSGGTIISNGGSAITVSGIVWDTVTNPTTALATKTTDGWAIGGPWVSSMTGLNASITYHVRAYATNSVGTSYGADVAFTTGSSVVMSGTMSAPNCTIALNGNNCTTTLTWSVTNPEVVLGSAVTSNTNNAGAASPNFVIAPPVSTGNRDAGTKSGVIIPYSSRTFFLYNNSKSLVPTSPSGGGIIVTATCTSGTVWNAGSGTCQTTASPLNVTLTANPLAVFPPGTTTSTLTWSSTGADSCTGTNFNTGNATSTNPPGGVIVTPVYPQTTYTINCIQNLPLPGQQLSDSETVTVGSGVKKPIFIEN